MWQKTSLSQSVSQVGFSTWDLPSVEAFRQNISVYNDGTIPCEPWARIPSNIMEAWLREKCNANPLIDTRYGWAVEGLVEYEDRVEVHVHDRASNISKTICSPYVVGYDGAWSAMRKGLGAELVRRRAYVSSAMYSGSPCAQRDNATP